MLSGRKFPWDGLAVLGLAAMSSVSLAKAYLETHIGDAESALSFPVEESSGILTRAHVEELNRKGICVLHNVLTPVEVKSAHKGCKAIHHEGRLQPTDNESSVRQDLICWVRESDGITDAVATVNDSFNELEPGLLHCVKLLRSLPRDLETLDYCRSSNHYVPKQCQLSRYNGTGSYIAHRDAVKNYQFWEMGILEWLRASDYRKRRITAILYINLPGWDAEIDGGDLKYYLGCDDTDITGSTASSVGSVSPRGGTLVLFDSTEILHEVRPSLKERYALTLWITGEDNCSSNY